MKKTVALLCAAAMAFSFASCGGNDTYDPLDPDQIKLVVSDLGFGTDQFYAIAEAFETTHPGKKVEVEETVLSSALISQLEAGSFVGDICMFNDDALWRKWRSGIMTPLDDVLSSVPDGETLTVEEKCDPALIEAYEVSDGHYYSVPWINENTGFVYNETALNILLGENQWELPKTTEELYDLCDRIKSAGGYGFVWNDAYIDTTIFEAQYNGREAFNNMRAGKYYDEESGEWVLSDAENLQCLSENTGYLRAMEQLEKIIGQYSHQYCRNMTFIYAQAAWAGIPYANDTKLSVFMPNGDWAYNETKDYFDETGHVPGFMKVPVVSDLVERLSLYEDGETPFSQLSEAKKAEYDRVLRAMIDYVDGDTQTPPTWKGNPISEEDMAIVREARSLLMGKSQAQAFIPSNSTKKELAKEFLVFMASDMAIQIYSQNTNGLSPYLDQEQYTSVSFDSKFMNEVTEVCSESQKAVYAYTDVKMSGYYLPHTTSYAQAFSGGNYTARGLWEADIAYYKANWNTILKNAGLAQ